MKIIAGILTATAICVASAAQAHPVHYAVAAADASPTLRPIPKRVHTALGDNTGEARAAARAQCRKAAKRDCTVIAKGTLPHPHSH